MRVSDEKTSRLTKIIYGAGDLGFSITSTIIATYFFGIGFWALVQILLITVTPESSLFYLMVMTLCVLAGRLGRIWICEQSYVGRPVLIWKTCPDARAFPENAGGREGFQRGADPEMRAWDLKMDAGIKRTKWANFRGPMANRSVF